MTSAAPATSSGASSLVSGARGPESKLLWDYLLLSLLLVVSRGLLYLAGLRFNLVLDWMFLADPVDLQEHLLQSLFYFHAYPPGMNLLTGLLLKLGATHVAELAQCTFWMAGLVLFNSLLYLGRALGLPRAVALGLCLAFSLTPPSLYLENLYIYEYPAAALLCLAAALFHRGISRPTFAVWTCFFLVFAILAVFRSTFHLFWFAALALGVVVLVGKPFRRQTALAALAPAALLLALYVKNYAVFGVFGATSWGGANLVAVTTRNMPPDVRRSWVRQEKVSPFVEISVFAGPAAYSSFFESPESGTWPALPILDALDRPSHGAGNFNHWWFLDINKQRREDSVYYLKNRPLDYLDTVFHVSLVQLFSPTTQWHPDDKGLTTPHLDHRRVLGGYERTYNQIVHGWPSPGGLYSLLPFFFGWAVVFVFRRFRASEPEARAQALSLGFCLLHMAYVLAVSCLFTAGECSRYRYLIEPFIWLTVARALLPLGAWARHRAAKFGLFPATGATG